MNAPTVYLVIAGEAIAREEPAVPGGHSEILSTQEFRSDGTPDWADAAICDARGGGGQAGVAFLDLALTGAEANARLCGLEIVNVPRETPAVA